jgi:hypothetical protein
MIRRIYDSLLKENKPELHIVLGFPRSRSSTKTLNFSVNPFEPRNIESFLVMLKVNFTNIKYPTSKIKVAIKDPKLIASTSLKS